MTLTLLLDLDDTLIENDINKFLPVYLKALAKQLSSYVAPEIMVKELLAATDRMIANALPSSTLEEAFDAWFYPHIDVSKDILAPLLAEFYENIFPSLRDVTRPRPEAVKLVEKALARGFTLVIATNPLFPARAIQHRLAWGNLGIETHAYSVVSSYEKFHFAKPNPAFYAECLARTGWQNQPAVMVGNSLSDDLIPAGKLNIPGFWLSDGSEPLPQGLPALSRIGSLADVEPWLDEILNANPLPAAETPEALLAVLKSTPATFDAFAHDLPADKWNINTSDGEWCFTEIMCHLRDADREINLPRFDRITNEVNAFLPGINADIWSETRGYCSENGLTALEGYVQARIDLLERLSSLDSSQWKNTARHAIFGPTTLKELVTFIVQHDKTHIQQAIQTIHELA
jgi:FMN phosphatase YigB (HAD superfamily)